MTEYMSSESYWWSRKLWFTSSILLQLDNTVGRCHPLWGVYTELHISVCYDVVDGLVSGQKSNTHE